MFGPTLSLVVVVLGFAAAPDPTDLVNQLGSPRYALRESAESELARLGRAALPALKDARDSKDPEIRTRVSAILSRIENSLLLEATPIALDVRDASLTEVVDAINRQAGLALTLPAEEAPQLARRRVTFRSGGPLPFWRALDALCAGAGLHHVQGNSVLPGASEGTLSLFEGPVAPTGPISDSGPFRVALSSIHLQSEIQLHQPRPLPIPRGLGAASGPDLGGPATYRNKQFFLQLLVAAEPRLSITQNGEVKLTSVVDDRNQSLLNPPGPGAFQHSAGYFGISPSPSLRLRVDLQYPASPGKALRLIRGTIPVVVTTRRPDPVEVPLGGSAGKSFRNDEVELTLLEYRPALDKMPATIQVAFKPLRPSSPPVDSGVGEPLGYRTDPTRQKLEVLDDQGRPLSWFPSSTFYNGEESRLTISLGARGASGLPATLRLYSIIRVNSDVAFEFRDIPIP